jgi:CBS domain-containing protein
MKNARGDAESGTVGSDAEAAGPDARTPRGSPGFAFERHAARVREGNSALVRDVMTRAVATCTPDAPLAQAAGIMWGRDCGFVPVTDVETGALLGVVTDRDACMAAYIQGHALADIPVHTAMTRDVATVREDEPLWHAHALMRERQVRRLPVVDEARRVVGVVSLNDVALHAVSREGERVDVATTLGEVCRHRDPRPA